MGSSTLPGTDLAKAAARPFGRLGPAALDPLRARLEAARPPLRAHIVKAIGRLAPEPSAVGVLLAALEDADPKTRRNAAIALGHVARQTSRPPCSGRGSAIEPADAPHARGLARQDGQRAIAPRASRGGAVGGRGARSDRGRARAPWSSGPRRAARGGASTPRARPPGRCPFSRSRAADSRISSRRKLSEIAAVVETRPDGPGRVGARLAGSIDAPLRRADDALVSVPAAGASPADPPRRSLRRSPARPSAAAREIFATWTEGPVRYRIAWRRRRPPARGDLGSVSRNRVCARRTSSTIRGVDLGDRRLARRAGRWTCSIAPGSLVDPRSPGAGRTCPPPPSDRRGGAGSMWRAFATTTSCGDPFVGSGAELIERALARPGARALRQRRRSARARNRARTTSLAAADSMRASSRRTRSIPPPA